MKMAQGLPALPPNQTVNVSVCAACPSCVLQNGSHSSLTTDPSPFGSNSNRCLVGVSLNNPPVEGGKMLVAARACVSGLVMAPQREMMALFAFSYVRNYSPIQTCRRPRTSVCSASPSVGRPAAELNAFTHRRPPRPMQAANVKSLSPICCTF